MKPTLQQQAANCDQLAALLENLPPQKYDHNVWSGKGNHCGTVACALGWAAHAGIGGLKIFKTARNRSYPALPEEAVNYRCPEQSSETVFGEGVFKRIFSGERLKNNPEFLQRESQASRDLPSLALRLVRGKETLEELMAEEAKHDRVLSIELLREQAEALRAIDKVLTTVENVLDDVPEAVAV